MDIKNIICDICGNTDFGRESELNYQKVPFGNKVEFNEEILICKKCGNEIDYSLNFTNIYEEALKESEKSSVTNILDKLQTMYKLVEIENALSLPIRTLSRWKKYFNYSHIGLTLLKIIRCYPWIVKVAAKGFDAEYADSIFKSEAIKKFNLDEKKITVTANYSTKTLQTRSIQHYVLTKSKKEINLNIRG